jgi:hypothetical protein
LKILKNILNIRLVKVRNNEAFGAIRNTLTLGIKAAKNEYLFTDADCYQIQRLDYSDELAIYDAKNDSIGYGGYEKIANSFLNKLIRFETLLTAMQYFSWAKVGHPYMGVGRNLTYKERVF